MTAASSPTPGPVRPLDWARQTGKVSLVLDQLQTKLQKRRRRQRRTAVSCAAALVIAVVAAWAVPLVRDTGTITTAAARRQTVALADGSTLELNAGTDARTDFRYGRRTVRLERGEAFFSVANDPGHPFLVETSAGIVRVTGTQFNVRLTADHRAEVTLLEGAVTVQPSASSSQWTGSQPSPSDPSTFTSQLSTGSLNLTPSQQIRLGEPVPVIRTLTAAQSENVVAWRTGRVVLDGLTLGEAAARFAAYHGRTIAVAPETAALRVGGSCPLDDLPGFLDFLGEALPVRVLSRADGGFRILAK